MLRLAIPNITNVWQITLKDTALISVTGLVEIMRQSYIAAGSQEILYYFIRRSCFVFNFNFFFSMKDFK